MTASLTAPTTMVVTYLKQWMFDPNNPRHALLPKPQFSGPTDRNYNLKNSRTKKFLQWEEQTWGINLGWTDNADATTAKKVSRWFISRKATGQTPIKYGEPIALGYGISPSFVHYEERTVGINLGWSEIALVYFDEINASDIIDPNLVVPGPLPSDLAPDLGESKLDEFPYRVAFPSGKHIIIRLRLLLHEPHASHEIARVAPISLGVEIANIKTMLETKLNGGNGAGDLAGDKGLSPQWTFMVEQDAVAGKQAISLTVIDGDPIGVKLGHAIG
jgi:hypothetical protein